MAKWNQKKDVESHQRNIRVTAGDNYRVEELDVPLLEPFPEYVNLFFYLPKGIWKCPFENDDFVCFELTDQRQCYWKGLGMMCESDMPITKIMDI